MRQIYEQGVSLIELLVAVTILAIGVVPLVGVIMYGLNTGNRASHITLATNFARDLAEEIRTQAFSEELVYEGRDPACDISTVYPKIPGTAQCFGKDSGETVTDVAGNGGRITVFDDTDDYNGWCRGIECPTAADRLPLETYDGYQYSGTQGYPNAIGFTRRVRIHNLDVGEDRSIHAFYADPFPDYTSTDSTQYIKRYDFENWSALTWMTDDGGNTVYAQGRTPLKRIEVIVTYNGPTVKGVEVVDVSYVVMPYIKIE